MSPVANHAFPTGLVESLLRADLEDLRLDAFEGLAKLRAEAELADGEFLERLQMLSGNADDGRKHPGLAFRILAVDIAGQHLESFKDFPIRQLGLSAQFGKTIEGIQSQILRIRPQQ